MWRQMSECAKLQYYRQNEQFYKLIADPYRAETILFSDILCNELILKTDETAQVKENDLL